MQTQTIETRIPARLDRLPWGKFQTLVVAALGITWILDGLEVTIAGSITPVLKTSPSLHFTDLDIGYVSTSYLIGTVVGAFLFGWLTDRLGRKRLFFVTLGLYLTATALTAFSTDFWTFMVFRFFTGMGIGGEYTAVNSTIQEMVPARFRGRTDLAINGSFWIGGALGAVASIVLIGGHFIDPQWGWRGAFFIGALLGLAILGLRAYIPESPRWLVIHGREREAEEVLSGIEAGFGTDAGAPSAARDLKPMKITTRSHTPLAEVFRTIFIDNRQRAIVGLILMGTQSFFYNGIFFTAGQVLEKFHHVSFGDVGWYLLPFCLGNFMGPLLLGPLFDIVGRKPMIAGTYFISAVLLAVTGWLFVLGWVDATRQTLLWMAIFFFASPAAGAAYLTVSETFPVEIRALAIAVFYALGTLLGAGAPTLFSALVSTGSTTYVFYGYLLAAGLMLLAAVVQAIWGTAAEGKSLEDVSKPLSQAA